MAKVEFFHSITIDLPYEKIYARLGYAKGITVLNAQQEAHIEQYIDEAFQYIALKGAACRIPIEKNQDDIVIAGDIRLESKDISKFLRGSDEIVFIGATAGGEVIDKIKEYSQKAQMDKAVIFDATASEMVDDALSWIMDFLSYQIRRENKQFTPHRYSAGYGDFSLDNQKIICETLQMSALDVTLTDHCVLIPEKTVTAIAGIEPIL